MILVCLLPGAAAAVLSALRHTNTINYYKGNGRDCCCCCRRCWCCHQGNWVEQKCAPGLRTATAEKGIIIIGGRQLRRVVVSVSVSGCICVAVLTD